VNTLSQLFNFEVFSPEILEAFDVIYKISADLIMAAKFLYHHDRVCCSELDPELPYSKPPPPCKFIVKIALLFLAAGILRH
jgi:hypothetical protein